MNIHFTFKIAIAVAAIAAVGAMIILIAAGVMHQQQQPGPAAPNPLRSSTDARYLRLHTVEHDGHLIIAMYNGSIMHHPDCPCTKQNEGTTLK